MVQYEEFLVFGNFCHHIKGCCEGTKAEEESEQGQLHFTFYEKLPLGSRGGNAIEGSDASQQRQNAT